MTGANDVPRSPAGGGAGLAVTPGAERVDLLGWVHASPAGLGEGGLQAGKPGRMSAAAGGLGRPCLWLLAGRGSAPPANYRELAATPGRLRT